MTADGYPILFDLAGRRVVLVGGGAVAARRIPALLAAGALITVIDPEPAASIDASAVELVRRTYAEGDLAEAWFAHACTSDPAVNAAVAAEAERLRIPCVRADDARGGTARTPAVARADGVTVAVNASDDPLRAAAVRDAVALALDAGELPVREVRRRAGGWVALVGGGPGDPALMTVRARRLLAQADVVVIDRLAPSVKGLLSDSVEVIDVGKAPGSHRKQQEEINALLVDRAQRGQRVVRLKGGDPFVLGRGGEELKACVDAGVDVEVVPGVTSAIAGPAAARIPLTHRGISADFAVLSVHRDPTLQSEIDWSAASRGASTLVLLMAMAQLDHVAAELIRHGRAADTPTAVVQNATLPTQRVVTSTLADIAEDVRRAGVGSPAVVVVGEVVRVRAETS